MLTENNLFPEKQRDRVNLLSGSGNTNISFYNTNSSVHIQSFAKGNLLMRKLNDILM